MTPGDSGIASAAMPEAQEQECPSCRARHSASDGDFCEVCGYNFKTGVCGNPFAHEPEPAPAAAPIPETTSTPAPPIAAEQSIVAPEAPTELPEISDSSAPVIEPSLAISVPEPVERPSASIHPSEARRWQLVSSIDLSITGVPEEEGPADRAARIFPLDLQEQLIGRRSTRRGINPEISLDTDDGVSHRHASIIHQPDGSFALLDLGSSNGTLLNGQELKPNVPTPLAEGDRIGVGRWTCLTFQARA